MAVEQFFRGSGLAADAVAGRVGLLAGAIDNDQTEQCAHLVAGILGEHAMALGGGVAGTDLEQGRGAIDAAVEQSRIAACKVQRSDRDAVAEADGQGFERAPARSRRQGPAALLEFDLNPIEEAEGYQRLIEEVFV